MKNQNYEDYEDIESLERIEDYDRFENPEDYFNIEGNEDYEDNKNNDNNDNNDNNERSAYKIYDELPQLNYDSKNSQNILISDIMTLIDAALVVVRNMKDNYFNLIKCDDGCEMFFLWMLHNESELNKVQFCIQAKKKSNS